MPTEWAWEIYPILGIPGKAGFAGFLFGMFLAERAGRRFVRYVFGNVGQGAIQDFAERVQVLVETGGLCCSRSIVEPVKFSSSPSFRSV